MMVQSWRGHEMKGGESREWGEPISLGFILIKSRNYERQQTTLLHKMLLDHWQRSRWVIDRAAVDVQKMQDIPADVEIEQKQNS